MFSGLLKSRNNFLPALFWKGVSLQTVCTVSGEERFVKSLIYIVCSLKSVGNNKMACAKNKTNHFA